MELVLLECASGYNQETGLFVMPLILGGPVLPMSALESSLPPAVYRQCKLYVLCKYLLTI